jgi:hypothetical protein
LVRKVSVHFEDIIRSKAQGGLETVDSSRSPAAAFSPVEKMNAGIGSGHPPDDFSCSIRRMVVGDENVDRPWTRKR